MSSFGLTSYVNHLTRPVSGSCLDHTFARFTLDIRMTVHILDTAITDHSTIYGILDFDTASQLKTKNITSRSKKINYKSLNEFLVNEQWEDIYRAVDPNIAYNLLINKLKSYIEKSSSSFNYKNKYVKLKPWISYALSKKICHKNKLCKKAKKFPNNKFLQATVTALVKEIKIETAKTKEKFYLNKFNENGNDSKKNWNTVNEIISSKPKCSAIPVEILSNSNIILDDPLDIANEFNEYFVNIASQLKNDFSHIHSSSDSYHKTYDKSMFINPVTPIELINVIGTLENKTSLDADGLSNIIIKNICFSIVDILCFIFNLSFVSGVVPNKLKTAVVLSIHKKGNKLLKENYRPISILPVLSKILEKVMKSRMLNFLTDIKFFNDAQFGFREKLNTESALLQVLNNVYTKLNDDLKCAGVFLDIKKAFDLVEHNLLLEILYKCGFRGICQNWFKSYLFDRNQCVKINSYYSDYRKIRMGVPQGSVLGPLLFLIYINSIFELKLHGALVAFADDMALVYDDVSNDNIIKKINIDLVKLSSWFEFHGMVLSEKSKAMFFQITGQPISGYCGIKYHVINCDKAYCCNTRCLDIECVSDLKYLGVNLDSHLNWKSHVTQVSNYLSHLLRKLFILRRLCPHKILKNVYFSMIQSKLEYAIVCWGGIYESNLKPIINLQKYIIRLINFKSRFSSSWPIFVKSHILPLRHLYHYKVLKVFFNRSGNRCYKMLTTYNIRSNHQSLRVIPRAKKEHFRRYYLSTSPIIFNQLPYSIRSCNKYFSFLKLVKDWLFCQTKPEIILSTNY